MDPHDFLEVANDLVGGASEAEWRSAVSRAYYASFHLAQKLFVKCGFVVPEADRAHGYLWLRLQNCGHTDLCDVGIRLKDLRSARNAADYDLNKSISHHKAIDLLQMADEVVESLDTSIEMDDIIEIVTQNIKRYETDVLKDITWQP